MVTATVIETIDDITNAIVEVDNFLNDLQDDGTAVDIEELVRLRRSLDVMLKFFKAEG